MYFNCVIFLIARFIFSLVNSTNIVKNSVLTDDNFYFDSTDNSESANAKRHVKNDLMKNNVWDIFINGKATNHPNLGLNAHFQPYNPSQLTWNLIKQNVDDVEQKVTITSNKHREKESGKCSTETGSKKGNHNVFKN